MRTEQLNAPSAASCKPGKCHKRRSKECSQQRREFAMALAELFVSIDVSRAELKVCEHPAGVPGGLRMILRETSRWFSV